MTSPLIRQVQLPESGAFTARDGHDEIIGDSASETASQQGLEVILEDDDDDRRRRRQASLLPADAAALARLQRTTASFIHSLLAAESASSKPETRASSSSVAVALSAGASAPESAAHSRFLTKRQLSDIALGVRELSKHLGGIRLKLHVQKVFVLTKAYDESLIANTRDLARWLLSAKLGASFVVYVEETLEKNPKFDADAIEAENPSARGRLRYWTKEMCGGKRQIFDFVITLGGDGTVLYASWLFQRIVPPVLSFALGSLGFLTQFDYSDFPHILTSAFGDGVTVSLRLRFEGTVMRSRPSERGRERNLVDELVGVDGDADADADDTRTHEPAGTHVILNDIVIDRGPSPTMSSLEVFGDNEHFTSVQADGICVSTPTGSTAYNLAAGGSLCHPENPVVLVTAICPHTLSFRPIILPDTMVLRVGVPYDARTNSWASFDGRERVELHAGDYVSIAASRYPFANVLPHGRRSEDWVTGIRRMLQWNSRQRQKRFTTPWVEEDGPAVRDGLEA
ncbi:MAG: hypothetical protein M1826_004716 [Phylliscum demangeonii]|nr:MAG: hypothetical protein M1826_004716 [Phylliscum demangeonii]